MNKINRVVFFVLVLMVGYMSIAASQPLPNQSNLICFDATKPVYIYKDTKIVSYSYKVTNDTQAVINFTFPVGSLKNGSGVIKCKTNGNLTKDNLPLVFFAAGC